MWFDETTWFPKSIQCDQKQYPLHYKRGREEVDGIALCFHSKWHLEKGPCSLWTSHAADVGWFWIDLGELVSAALCLCNYSISCNSLVSLILCFSCCRLTFHLATCLTDGHWPPWWGSVDLFIFFVIWLCVFRKCDFEGGRQKFLCVTQAFALK